MMDRIASIEDFGATWLSVWAETTSDCSIFALSPEGVVLTWNPGGERIQGYSPTEIIGKPFSIFYLPEDRAAGVPERILRAASETGRHVVEGWRVRKDGSTFWANVVMTALHDAAGTLVGFGNVVRDVSDTRAAHEAVLRSERNFRLLVNGVTDYAIFMLSPQGYVTSWNAGARRIKGYTESEILGVHFSRFYPPEDVTAGLPARGLETARRDGRFEAEGWRVRRDGSRFFAHVVIDAIHENGQLAGFAKITRDITERRRANELLEETQRALYQAQKMDALGKLTGGVAHDFNNLLQVLRGNLELLESRYGHDSWSGERLANAFDAVTRGARLTSHLLAFGRQQPLAPVVVNAARQLQAIDDLLRRALGETIEIESVIAGGLWNTLVDPHQFQNVILNLAINARDAMPEGGKLTLELANATLDDEYVASFPDVNAGQYVMLAVTDTGTGMSREVMERAFDPFFSTKPEGRGTGLGLSMAYGFVKQSGGHIRLYSEVGEGTTVRLYLPRATGSAIEVTPSPAARPQQRGNESILVVEDDLKVQATVVDLLMGLGYTVLKANDATQALHVVASGVHIDLLFTDVVMPGEIRSPEMAQKAAQMLPDLKVLFTSGYTQNAIVHSGRLDPGVQLLSKPYSREQLAAKVRQVLDTPKTRQRRANACVANGGAAEPARRNARGLRVLVVEDDVAALDATCELIRMIGADPSPARTAAEARQLCGAENYDLLFTDLNLPDMSGIDLAAQLAVQSPRLQVVFASGNPVPDRADLTFQWTALRKPFTLEQLRAAVDP